MKNFSCLILLIMITLCWNPAQAGTSIGLARVPAGITGWFGSIFVHETGHLTMGLLTFSSITHFKPYPHRLKGHWVGGSVGIKGTSRFWAPFIYLSGVAASSVWAYYGSPLLPSMHNGFFRDATAASLYMSAVNFPVYVLFDMIAPSGDMFYFKQSTGIPTWTLLVPSVVIGYLLFVRVDSYNRKKSGDVKMLGKTVNVGMHQAMIPALSSAADTGTVANLFPSLFLDPSSGTYGVVTGFKF